MRLYVGQLAHGTTGRAAPLAAVVQALLCWPQFLWPR